MTIVTIWALFGDDIRLLATEKPADDAFVILTTICLFGFCPHPRSGCGHPPFRLPLARFWTILNFHTSSPKPKRRLPRFPPGL